MAGLESRGLEGTRSSGKKVEAKQFERERRDRRRVISLVVCDLDGTLLGPCDRGLDQAREAVSFSRKAGASFTIATGRAFAAAERYLSYMGIETPIITNGGAMVSFPGREPIMERTIDVNVAREIGLELRRLRVPFYYIMGKEMITEWKGPETRVYSENLGYEIKIVPSLADSLSRSPTQIVVRSEPEFAAHVEKAFSYRWASRVSVKRTLPHLIEFQPRGVSKARALDFLARRLGVARVEVLAIGDSLNDLDMLDWAGQNACVGNAHPFVKERVFYVAKSEYSEGVMEILERYLGGDQEERRE